MTAAKSSKVIARFASRNATQVRVSIGGNQVAVRPGGEGSVVIGAPNAGAYDVEAVAFDARGRQSIEASIRLTVDRALPEARVFAVTPPVFRPGDTVEVSWSFRRADQITITSDAGETLTTTTATAGAVPFTPDASRFLTLEAANSRGVTERFATVEDTSR